MLVSKLMTMREAIAYIRVSTLRQEQARLGIEAQRQAVQRFAAAEGFTILREHIEVETVRSTRAFSIISLMTGWLPPAPDWFTPT